MSRIGKKPIPIPEKVQVSLEPGNVVRVKGPLGELTVQVHPDITVEIDAEAKEIRVKRPSDEKRHKALHGTMRQLIANAVKGVTQGFRKELLVVGNGYRAEMRGKALVLNVGYTHEVVIEPPEGIKIEVLPDRLTINNQDAIKVAVSGIDKQLVGQVAANIRAVKPPEVYKGKGIRYADEVVRLKPGKAAAGGA